MDNIRINSGKYRGRSIKSPKSSLTHPMGAREKIALFNMIGGDLPGAVVLDAFSGSGALGIEALSRGAREVVFVEKNPQVAKNLKNNIESLGLDEVSEVIIVDAGKLSFEKKFDLIIADPPYNSFDEKTIEHLAQFLKPEGKLILSHPGTSFELENMKLIKDRQYAGAHIAVFTF